MMGESEERRLWKLRRLRDEVILESLRRHKLMVEALEIVAKERKLDVPEEE